MDDDLATVIPFPLHRAGGRTPLPEPEDDPRPEGAEQYWALVQSLAAERRALGRGAG